MVRTCVQRLFSTFAEGWPGAGLLLQRVLTSTVLLYFGGTHFVEATRLELRLPYLIGDVAGALRGFALSLIRLAGRGGTTAMIGPGMWSIDAKLYGRKLLADPRH
jgi:hypothetical protein